ncbi:MAG TPA: hypothetical protein VM370_08275 [Candidatus Thermoplasmatota archaeon]|nr:hypothetical protein [Candidatus Thermoplasmatota archaeon]
MQMRTLGTTILLLTAGFTLLAGAVAAEEPSHACSNYGVQTQVTVVGDNENMNCTIQHCETGPQGAGAAGVGVGTAAGDGEAGAEASAGAACDQSAGGGDPDPGSGGCEDSRLLDAMSSDSRTHPTFLDALNDPECFGELSELIGPTLVELA